MLVVEDKGEGLDPAVWDKTDYAARLIDNDGGVVLRLGVVQVSLLGQVSYLWMVPGPCLTASRAKGLKKMWKQAVAGGKPIIILLDPANAKAIKWAKFFGFEKLKSQEQGDLYGLRGSRA